MGYFFISDFPPCCSCCSFSEYFSCHSCPLPSLYSFLRPNLMPWSQGMYNMPLYNFPNLLWFISAGLVEGLSILCVFFPSWQEPKFTNSPPGLIRWLRAAEGVLEPRPSGCIRLNHVSMSLLWRLWCHMALVKLSLTKPAWEPEAQRKVPSTCFLAGKWDTLLQLDDRCCKSAASWAFLIWFPLPWALSAVISYCDFSQSCLPLAHSHFLPICVQKDRMPTA